MCRGIPVPSPSGSSISLPGLFYSEDIEAISHTHHYENIKSCTCIAYLIHILSINIAGSVWPSRNGEVDFFPGYFPGVLILKADVSEHSVGYIFTGRRIPKSRLLIFRRRGNTKKKIYLIYNTAKVWKLRGLVKLEFAPGRVCELRRP
jgi:hypothetical protein